MHYEKIMRSGGTAERYAQAGDSLGTVSALYDAWQWHCHSLRCTLPSDAKERARELLVLADRNRSHGPHPKAEIDVGFVLWQLDQKHTDECNRRSGPVIGNHIGASV